MEVVVTESQTNDMGSWLRRGLSLVWTVGLFAGVVLAVPYSAWWLADSLDALYLMFVPMGGCLYLVCVGRLLDDEQLRPMAWFEDPFTRQPDPRARILLVLLPTMANGMMALFFLLGLMDFVRA